MNFFNKVTGFVRMLLNIYREDGFDIVLKTIDFKLKRPSGFSISQLSIQDWLRYYKKRYAMDHLIDNDRNKESEPKISILILTYNNLPISQICLYSIYCNTTYPNFEVIVVDNCSSDETPEWLKEFSSKQNNMKIILNSENRGFASGNNQAAKVATGKYLVFLNNDTIVTRGWLERLLKHLQIDPNIGLIGPVTNSTGNEARIPVDYRSPSKMELFADRISKKMDGKSFDIRMLAFYCVMTSKEQFEKIGGLDECYGIGMFEDDDLARRYQINDYRVVCAEDVFIHHFQGASFGKLEEQKYNHIFEENKRKYESKWGAPWKPYKFRHNIDSEVSRNDN